MRKSPKPSFKEKRLVYKLNRTPKLQNRVETKPLPQDAQSITRQTKERGKMEIQSAKIHYPSPLEQKVFRSKKERMKYLKSRAKTLKELNNKEHYDVLLELIDTPNKSVKENNIALSNILGLDENQARLNIKTIQIFLAENYGFKGKIDGLLGPVTLDGINNLIQQKTEKPTKKPNTKAKEKQEKTSSLTKEVSEAKKAIVGEFIMLEPKNPQSYRLFKSAIQKFKTNTEVFNEAKKDPKFFRLLAASTQIAAVYQAITNEIRGHDLKSLKSVQRRLSHFQSKVTLAIQEYGENKPLSKSMIRVLSPLVKRVNERLKKVENYDRLEQKLNHHLSEIDAVRLTTSIEKDLNALKDKEISEQLKKWKTEKTKKNYYKLYQSVQNYIAGKYNS